MLLICVWAILGLAIGAEEESVQNDSCASMVVAEEQPAEKERVPVVPNAEEVTQLQSLAEGGDAWAELLLAIAYEMGEGVEADMGQAVRWHRASAAQGNKYANARMAILCGIGKGVPADFSMATVYMQHTDGEALSFMADMLMDDAEWTACRRMVIKIVAIILGVLIFILGYALYFVYAVVCCTRRKRQV